MVQRMPEVKMKVLGPRDCKAETHYLVSELCVNFPDLFCSGHKFMM